MEKLWLKSYPPGVPEFIEPMPYMSIAALFNHAAMTYADSPSASNYGKTLTYRQLKTYVDHMASYFSQVLKLKKGDRVAIMMPNVLQYLIAMYGAFEAGLIVVNVNPLYTTPELVHQLNDCGADTVVVLANMASTLQEALPQCPAVKHVIITQLGDMFEFPKSVIFNFAVKYIVKRFKRFRLPQAVSFHQALREGAANPGAPVPCVPTDIAFLQYTGGTTGVSKAAMLTHANMLSNVAQGSAWIKGVLQRGQEVVITALPLYHIFSLMANCLMFTEMGAHNILITNPRDIPSFVRDLSRYRFSVITGVNTLFNAMLHSPSFAKLDFSHLKICMGGGMAVQHAVAQRWKAVTGKPLIEAYGLTETSPAVTMNPFNITEYTGSIGLPISSTEVKIIDDEGRECDLADTGELCVRGPQVMLGYWNMPDETALVLDKDGWLKTGDVAKIDMRGFVYLVDRKKDMVLVSGFNVYPNEVEAVVAMHPGVLECAVVGVPNVSSGQVVKLFVVKKDPNLTEKDLIDFCAERLTRYKIPKFVEFRSSLPKSNVGKILRRELR